MLQAHFQTIRRLLIGVVALAALYMLLRIFLVAPTDRDVFVIITLSLLSGAAVSLVVLASTIAPLYGMSSSIAIGTIIKMLLGLSRGVHIIEDGHTILPHDVDDASITGPRFVIVRCSAAVFYRGARYTRVSGPGFINTDAWEYVRHLFDLRPCQETLTYDHILTAERIPTQVELSVTYGIAVSPKTARGEIPMATAERNMILRMCTEMPEWKKAVQEEIERSLRQAVVNYRLDGILGPASVDALSQQVRANANARLNTYGIRVSRVSVLDVQPDDRLLQAANWARIGSDMELAKASTYRDTLSVIADAYRIAREMKMSDADMQREVLRRILECLAHDPRTASYPLTADVVQALMALRRYVGLSPS